MSSMNLLTILYGLVEKHFSINYGGNPEMGLIQQPRYTK